MAVASQELRGKKAASSTHSQWEHPSAHQREHPGAYQPDHPSAHQWGHPAPWQLELPTAPSARASLSMGTRACCWWYLGRFCTPGDEGRMCQPLPGTRRAWSHAGERAPSVRPCNEQHHPIPTELTDLTLRKRRCSPTRCHMHMSDSREVEVVAVSPCSVPQCFLWAEEHPHNHSTPSRAPQPPLKHMGCWELSRRFARAAR